MAAVSILQALTEAGQLLKDAGVTNVTVEPGKAVLPGIILYPQAVDYETLDAGPESYDLTVDVLMVASGGGTNATQITQVDALLAVVRDVFSVGQARAVGISLPGQSPDAIPALQSAVTLRVTPTEEG